MKAYPLYWPEGRPRLSAKLRERSRFETLPGRARDDILYEIRLLDGRNVTVSTNIKLRSDGQHQGGQKEPIDPGAAVYFDLHGRLYCFSCDRWDRVKDNMRAIAKTIGAIRGIKRWGASDMMEAAFRGFEALPAPKSRDKAHIGKPSA
jgi:hypothetical protein